MPVNGIGYPYPNVYNPYITTVQNPINYSTQLAQSYIHGRFISSQNEITPNEVAMDGTLSLFPMNDYSVIFAKRWNSDGTIKTIEFVPKVVEEQSTPQNDIFEQINSRFDKIEELLSQQTQTRQSANKRMAVNS